MERDAAEQEHAAEQEQPGSQKRDGRRLRRRRLRMAGERLTEDSSLRDALTDEQADQLIDWGMAYIQAEVDETLTLEDEPAAERLDERVTHVRRVMRQVNGMMDEWEAGDSAGHWQALLELGQALRPLQQQSAGTLESTQEIFTLGQADTTMDSETLFTQLMGILAEDQQQETGAE